MSCDPSRACATSTEAQEVAVDLNEADQPINDRTSDSMARFLEKQSFDMAPKLFRVWFLGGRRFWLRLRVALKAV